MQQTIYCDCFYCEHYEDGKCLSPVLHLGHHDCCHEFTPSDEKLDAHFDGREYGHSADYWKTREPVFYPPPKDRIRLTTQKNNP